MNLPTPPGFGPGYAAQRYSHTPMTRLPPGIAMYCSRRRGWGFWGGTYGYPPAGRGKPPPRSPPPEAIVTTVHCPGEPGDTPRSPSTLRRVGMITRTNTGVQQSLNLADSQPGTQVHPCGKFAPMGARPLPAQAGPGARWNRAGEPPNRQSHIEREVLMGGSTPTQSSRPPACGW